MQSSIHQTLAIDDMLSMIADSAKTIVQQLFEQTDLAILKNRMNELSENCKKLLSMFTDGYNDKK